MEAAEHLFRHEWGRIVAALTRILGVHNLALAEDVAQEAFCRAIEVWRFRGVPPNPSAWLITTAKNLAIDVLRRERTARTFAPELGELLEGSGTTLAPAVEQLFQPHLIEDDLLRMIFSCCSPQLPQQSQVALILHILCGFSVGEIASAFLSGHAATEKRITRAKKLLGRSKRLFDLAAGAALTDRLPAVHQALYLLFNEGYHGASAETAVRSDLCHEAMRLTAILLKHPLGMTPATYALSALMCLNAARLPARIDAAGNFNSLFHQDRSQWDQQLVTEGLMLLGRSASGSEVTEYHIEAAIASVHATASTTSETDWERIVSLYDALMAISPSPIVALNRAIAVAQRDGPDRGLEEIGRIASCDDLANYPFLQATVAELEFRRGNYAVARENFRAALGLARNTTERRHLQRRIDHLEASWH